MAAEPWRLNLRAIWASQFIAMIGMSGVVPFLPLYVRELGVPESQAPMWSGIIAAAPFVVAAMLTPLWGVLGDRYGQKSMVLRAVLGLGITVTLMGFAPTVQVLLILRLLQGAASGFVASNNAFVSAQTPSEHVGYSMTTLQTSLSAGNVIGPLVGGSLGDAFGHRWAFVLVGVLCLISFVVVLTLVREDRTKVSGRPGRVGKNLATVIYDPGLRILMLMLFVGQSAVVLTSPIFPFYLEQLGAPKAILASLAGAAVSIVGVCTVFAAPWWGKRSDRFGYRNTMLAVTTIIAIGMASQSLVPWYGWIFPVRVIIGLGVGALLPLTYAELSRRAPEGRKGGIMGLASSASLLGNFTGPLLCSALVSYAPVRYAFLASAVLIVVVHFLSRRLPPRTDAAAAVALLLCTAATAKPTGFFGTTTLQGGGCGPCHGNGPEPETVVELVDVASGYRMLPGQIQTFTIRISNPVCYAIGVNVAVFTELQGNVSAGELVTKPDGGLRLSGGELAHQAPRGAGGGYGTFSFRWIAPLTHGTYWIHAAGNATNGNTRNDVDDHWNWMDPVRIEVGEPSSVAPITLLQLQQTLELPATITVFDLHGRMVMQSIMSDHTCPSPLPTCAPAGIYAVAVVDRRGRAMRGLVAIP
jgi:MFS family permease